MLATMLRIAVATAAIALLAGCGSNPRERAAGGAGVGAASGAAVGAIFGGVGAIPGAFVGAALGGTSGALTTQDEVDLGPPVWK